MRSLMLRTFCLLSLGIFSFASMAKSGPSLSFTPKQTASQKSFNQALKNEEFSKALAQFDQAFGSRDFSRSVNGLSLKAYLMYQSDLKLTGLENLARIPRLQKMHPEMKRLWLKSVDANDNVFEITPLSWNKNFTGILPLGVSAKMGHGQDLRLTSAQAVRNLARTLSANSKKDTAMDTWKRWNIALYAPVYDNPELGLQSIKELRQSGHNQIGKDLIDLTEARIYYQMNKMDQAVQAYQAIPKSSDYWIEAQEELAWAFLRTDQAEKSLAHLKSLKAPLFKDLLGPEPFVTMNLSHLAICDYTSIFKNSEDFKKRFSSRVESLSKIEKGQNPEVVRDALQKLSQKFALQSISSSLGLLPRQLRRDQVVKNQLAYKTRLQAEAHSLEQIRNSGLTSKSLNELGSEIQRRVKNTEKSLEARIRLLARSEMVEIRSIVQRLHLIEAEVIQRMHMEERVVKRDSEKSSGNPHSGEVLSFPDTDEFWLDEIGNYAVSVKECPKLKQVSL